MLPIHHGLTKPDSPAAPRWLTLAICGLLFLLVAIAFGQTTGYDFVSLDDGLYVYENQHVTPGLTVDGLRWAITNRDAGIWMPLCWLSHMLDCQLYGVSAGGHHLTNLLLHAATAILLFLALKRMTTRLWPSALAAALFAIHPLRAESVAWVTERKDVLSGLFFALMLWSYAGYAQRRANASKHAPYVAVLLCFALGLMAKPTLVATPLALLLLDYWPLNRTRYNHQQGQGTSGLGPINQQSGLRRLVLEKLPLAALAALSCLLTLWSESVALGANEDYGLPWRIGNASLSYVTYLAHFLWPANLTVAYPRAEANLPLMNVLSAFLLLAAITAVAVLWRKRCPYLLVGWFWYLVMLLPTIGLVQFGIQAEADRFTYLPQIGLCIAVAWLLADACRQRESCRERRRNYRRTLGVSAAVLAVVALTIAASRQASYWRGTESLWNHALACIPKNKVARASLASFLDDHHRPAEAIKQYQTAVRLDPNDAEAENNLGLALARRGRHDEAIVHYRRAIELKPRLAEAENNWGHALAAKRQYDDAMEHYQKALRIKPDTAQTHYNLGSALAARGRRREAIAEYRKAIALKPDFAEAYGNLGNVLAAQNRFSEAVATYRQALTIKPDSAKTRNNLGVALANQNHPDEAIAEYRQALRAKPDFADAYYNLANALASQGDLDHAIAFYQMALQLQPGDDQIRNSLRSALQRMGRPWDSAGLDAK